MCRIFGGVTDSVIARDRLSRASHLMLGGGPDQQWVLQNQNWAVGTNRLAIQGIDGGEQPFRSQNRVCVFNGEIYNHRELRAQLIGNDHNFTDACDGNVILPLFQEYGPTFVQHLEGMFALAILELDSNGNCASVFMAADQSAMKTLFYVAHETGLYFASSLKGLQALVPDRFTLRDGFVHEYVSRKAVWGPNTVFEDVYVLGAGETLRYDVKSKTHQCAMFRHSFAPLPVETLDDAADQFDQLMHAEISRMVDMDVGFCSVLSGGLDSSYITSIVKKHKDQLDAFHIGYEDNWPGDESQYARMVAEALDVKLHHIKVDVAKLPDYISEYVQHLDQPNFAPHCLSTYLLFKEISHAGYKVAITGEGADELFCGYGRLIQAATSKDENWFENFYSIYGVAPFQNGAYFNDEYLERIKVPETVQYLVNSPSISRAQSVLQFDTEKRFPYYILRRVDSLSMANSVEVRMPFLQPRMIDYARKLPDNMLFAGNVGKQCVLRAGEKVLPHAVVHRKKQPFTFPIQAIMAQTKSVRDYVFDTVFSQNAIVGDYFDMKRIGQFKSKDLDKSQTSVLWALLVLQQWHDANLGAKAE